MQEEDIRKRDVLNRYLELVSLDSEEIVRDKSSFEAINCPACGSSEYSHQFNKNQFSYVMCSNCDTLFVNPRPSFENLMKIYKDSPSTRFWVNDFFLPMVEARREKIFKPRAEYIASKFPQLKKGEIADVGAGFGLFLEELEKCWPEAHFTSIEPSIDMADICRQKGFQVIESMLEEVDSSKHKFDLITSFELFEHLHNPSTLVEGVKNLLNSGGYLFLTTLNGLGFDIQILWDKAKSVTPPHHLNFFNPSSICLLFKKAGFEIVEVSTPGQLDWDIIEGGYIHEGLDPGRFFKTVIKYGTEEAKVQLQSWIRKYKFSSHMRVIVKKR